MRGTSSLGNSSVRTIDPLSDPDSRQQTRKADEPRHIFEDWKARLGQVNVGHRKAVLAFLKNVALGYVEGSKAAQAVFNDLIAQEAYDLFLEVFAAADKIGRANAECDGKPFKTTLVLQLPLDWRPTEPALLHETLGRAQVQRVEVLRPPPDDSLVDVDDPSDIPISAAVCDAVAELLKGGASELAVRGVLARPDVVCNAMGAGDRFDSLELGEDRWPPLTLSESRCYATLLLGVKGNQLRHLTILQASLIPAQHNSPQAERPRWPLLTSLDVRGVTVPSIAPLQWLLSIAAESEHLTDVALNFSETATHAHVKPTLDRLKRHRALRKLAVVGAGISIRSASCLQVLAWTIELARSCRSLTHVKWDSKAFQVPGAVAAMKRNFSGTDIRDALLKLSPELEAALRDPAFRLRSLILMGMYLPSGLLESFFRGLEGNGSLEFVDFSTCAVDLRSTQILLKALKVNKTLKFMGMPPGPMDYYMVMGLLADPIQAFFQGKNVSSSLNAAGERRYRDDYQLQPSGVPASPASAQPHPFDNDLKEHADTLQAELHEQQRAIRPEALSELTLDLAQLLETSATLSLANMSSTHAAAFPDVASIIARHLENDGALRSIVHLSAVSRRVDRRRQASVDAVKRHADVQPFVKAHNRMAVAQGLPGAPLAVNKVNANGANEQLVKSLRTGARMLRQVLALDAIDFGRRVERTTPPGPLRRSFLAVNRVDANGANLQLMAAVEADDAPRVLRLLAEDAIDYHGHARMAAVKKSPEVQAACAKGTAPGTPARRLAKSDGTDKPHA